jgi:hypothetical protein
MKKINVFVWFIYFFSNGHKRTLGMDSYVCWFQIPLTNLDWNGAKDILFSKYFHVRRTHPSHPPNWFRACLDGMTTLHLTLVSF